MKDLVFLGILYIVIYLIFIKVIRSIMIGLYPFYREKRSKKAETVRLRAICLTKQLTELGRQVLPRCGSKSSVQLLSFCVLSTLEDSCVRISFDPPQYNMRKTCQDEMSHINYIKDSKRKNSKNCNILKADTFLKRNHFFFCFHYHCSNQLHG